MTTKPAGDFANLKRQLTSKTLTKALLEYSEQNACVFGNTQSSTVPLPHRQHVEVDDFLAEGILRTLESLISFYVAVANSKV